MSEDATLASVKLDAYMLDYQISELLSQFSNHNQLLISDIVITRSELWHKKDGDSYTYKYDVSVKIQL